MCLVAVAIGRHPRFPWVLASNRDEFHDRPAAPLAWWRAGADGPALLGGRDLSAGGTWLGLTEAGALALVTNVREPGCFAAGLPSRGDLVPHWLARPHFDPVELRRLAETPRNGFNLLLADLGSGDAAWVGNRPPQAQPVAPGLAALSNAALDTPWPKLTHLKTRLAAALERAATPEVLLADVLEALTDRAPAPDAELPATGVPLTLERQLSPAFIHIPAEAGRAAYGTRCSTVVIVGQQAGRRRVHVFERRFTAQGEPAGDTEQAWSLPGRDR